MNYYRFNIGDFAVMAEGMDEESVGILVRLMNRFAFTEKPIKTQWVTLGFREEIREKAMQILSALWEETENGWIYPPLLSQIYDYKQNADKNRLNGRKGGRPRKSETVQNETQSLSNETQAEPSGFLDETQTKAKKSLTINHEPLTNNQEINKEDRTFQLESQEGDSQEKTPKRETAKSILSKLEKPEDCSDKDWEDWVAFKKKKSKDCTQRMADALVREAHAAGITTSEAICIQLENGWSSFQADYLHGRNNRSSSAKAPVDIPPIDYHRGINPDGSF